MEKIKKGDIVAFQKTRREQTETSYFKVEKWTRKEVILHHLNGIVLPSKEDTKDMMLVKVFHVEVSKNIIARIYNNMLEGVETVLKHVENKTWKEIESTADSYRFRMLHIYCNNDKRQFYAEFVVGDASIKFDERGRMQGPFINLILLIGHVYLDPLS